MADPEQQLLYLEPDDEITSVVRRLRETDADRVVLVASGRSKATTSAVALRLLANVAGEEGREIALVADPAGRAMAAEAGIPAFPSVAEASVDGAVAPPPPPVPRAPIRILRAEPVGDAPLEAPLLAAADGSGDETIVAQAVAAPPPPAPVGGGRATATRAPRPRRTASPRARRALAAAGVVLVLLSAGGVAAVAPSASITVAPNRVPIEPVTYTVAVPVEGTDEGELTADVSGTATGVHREPTPATGTVVFSNWNTVAVEVAAGTRVAAGEMVFETVETIVVPIGFFTPFVPGENSVDVVASIPGPGGNVPPDAIDAVLSDGVRGYLRGLPDNPNRLVRNPDPTAGGSDNEEPKVTRSDVDAAVAAIEADLAEQLDAALPDDPDRVYGPVRTTPADIPIPDDLVGRRGEESFTLEGSQVYRRAYAGLAAVEAAAQERILEDADAAPDGREVVEDSIIVEVRNVSAIGDEMRVRVRVSALAAPLIDTDAIRALVVGRTVAEAEATLAWLGDVDVELWPGWVDRVPQLGWRIDLRVAGPGASGTPVP